MSQITQWKYWQHIMITIPQYVIMLPCYCLDQPVLNVLYTWQSQSCTNIYYGIDFLLCLGLWLPWWVDRCFRSLWWPAYALRQFERMMLERRHLTLRLRYPVLYQLMHSEESNSVFCLCTCVCMYCLCVFVCVCLCLWLCEMIPRVFTLNFTIFLVPLANSLLYFNHKLLILT